MEFKKHSSDVSFKHFNEGRDDGIHVWLYEGTNTLQINIIAFLNDKSMATLVHEMPAESAYALRNYLNTILD